MNNESRLKPALVEVLRATLNLSYFVETGSSSGYTAVEASTYFSEVYTCELEWARWRNVVHHSRRHPNIRPCHADSPLFLTAIRDLLDKPTMFWLDAHWDGGDEAGQDRQCPLLEELVAIGEIGPHVILIDDARLFKSPRTAPFIPEQWPSETEIRLAAAKLGVTFFQQLDDQFILCGQDLQRPLRTFSRIRR